MQLADPPLEAVPPGLEAVSTETAFVLEAEDARFLAEVGMLAASRGDLSRADRIFGFLRQVRPERAFPLVGLAVARLNAGRAEEAARLLQDVHLADLQEQAVVQSWCGLALQLAGHGAESRRMLSLAARQSGEGAVLAQQMLGLAVDDASNDS
ncbi:hypothetical protein [Castellaniella sp.]|uniref:hypothetical protein n=1 Tax=Castellaniella sp. TaxID=1955812 RepID=UPI002AFF1DF8|nr:hypothetical protein [Castellaniella sp.]